MSPLQLSLVDQDDIFETQNVSKVFDWSHYLTTQPEDIEIDVKIDNYNDEYFWEMIVSSHSIIEKSTDENYKVRELFHKVERYEKNNLLNNPTFSYCTPKTNKILTIVQSPIIGYNIQAMNTYYFKIQPTWMYHHGYCMGKSRRGDLQMTIEDIYSYFKDWESYLPPYRESEELE